MFIVVGVAAHGGWPRIRKDQLEALSEYKKLLKRNWMRLKKEMEELTKKD